MTRKVYIFFKGNLVLAPSRGLPYNKPTKAEAEAEIPKLNKEFGGFQTKHPIRIKQIEAKELHNGWPK